MNGWYFVLRVIVCPLTVGFSSIAGALGIMGTTHAVCERIEDGAWVRGSVRFGLICLTLFVVGVSSAYLVLLWTDAMGVGA